MKSFKGRVISAGTFKGEAVVSHAGFNTLASFQKAVISKKKQAVISDQNNKDLYGVNVTGKALCLPITIGSTTGGLVLHTVCSLNINPSCMLFSEHIDGLAASGIILSTVWEGSNIICIDQLGEEFLNTVSSGDQIEVLADGTVNIL